VEPSLKIRVAALIMRDESLLFMRYSYPGGEVYCLPGGGLAAGESLHDALARELLEELGLERVELGDLLMVCEQQETPHLPSRLHLIFRAFTAAQPTLNPLQTSANGLVWLASEALQGKALYPHVTGEFQDLLAGRAGRCYIGSCSVRSWS
jgi:ADP-ribose pyrophosphatase YjhB (NUDIX family)